jgi:hypothetical protein
MPKRRIRIRRSLKNGSYIILDGNATNKWMSYYSVDSITKLSGDAGINLSNADKTLTNLYEQFDAARIIIDGTTVFNGHLTDISPAGDRVLKLKARNLLHELQGEYIIESYGISQTSTTLVNLGTSVTFAIPSTTGFEVGDEVRIVSASADHRADSGTILQGDDEGGDITNTEEDDDSYWQVGENATNGIDVQLDFSLDGGNTASLFIFRGRYDGNAAHYVEVFAYNWSSQEYETLSTATNRLDHSSGVDYERDFYLDPRFTDSAGDVRLRLTHNTTGYNAAHALYLDQVLVCHSGGEQETANITSVVADTSITVDETINPHRTPVITVGEEGHDIVDDLVSKYGTGMTRTGISATSPLKFIVTFKGVTAFDAIGQISDEEEYEFGHDADLDFFYRVASFEDSGVTITYGTSRVISYTPHRSGADIINRVDIRGATIGDVQLAHRVEDPESQAYYGQVKGKSIVDEKIETVVQAEAKGNAILQERARALQSHTLQVVGYETLKAGQLVRLANFDGIPNSLYVLVEKRHAVPGPTTLKLAKYQVEFEQQLINLFQRMREREKEVQDADATVTKLLNFYETSTVAAELTRTTFNLGNGLIAGRNTISNQGLMGRGYNGQGGGQLVAGRYATEA